MSFDLDTSNPHFARAVDLREIFARDAAERDRAGGKPLEQLAHLKASGLLNLLIPQEFGGWLTALSTNPLVYLLIVNVLLLVVGCFMEALAAMLVLIPILVPTAQKLGIDPVQFGLIFVLNLMIGTITPPVGVVLFVTAKVAGVPFDRLARATLPYLWTLIAVLALITLWPAATTFLPHLLLDK